MTLKGRLQPNEGMSHYPPSHQLLTVEGRFQSIARSSRVECERVNQYASSEGRDVREL